MMNNNPLIRVLFSEVLEPQEKKSFRYKIENENLILKGILHTGNSELSISFKNQDNIEIESLETLVTNIFSLPPSKRILAWKEDLKRCSYVTGTIKNISKEKRKLSIYLFVE